MTDEEVLEVIGERGKNRDTIALLKETMLGVVACLDSIYGDDINSCHPSCREYILGVLRKVDLTTP